ncbi:MAG: methyl-accepting chemotaxis protein [Thiotrichales bacterium]
MRQNLPVSQNVFDLPEGVSLVSKTNLKGQIIYANQSFIELSGFSRDELIGQPHNIVRHPDMPPEAFADLWDTIQRGLPWSGIVKNRCKSGNAYWVRANVTPVREAGRTVGFMSVRTHASAAEIAAAEAIYADLRNGNMRGRRLEEGFLRNATLLGRLVCTGNWSLRATIRTVSVLNAVVVGVVGGAFAFGAPTSLLLGATVAVASICLATGVFLERSIARPLETALEAARGIAGGEVRFRTQCREKNDVARLLRALEQIAMNFAAIVKDIKNGTDSIHRATRELASETNGLSQRTEQQAGNLMETASNMEELTATVRRNAEKAVSASQISRDASRIAEDGGAAVRNVIAKMGAITASSHQIADVVGLIDDMAFQTNLLALNAAVEAAHAGQHGKGFAVVATEVRNLAQRSAEAAREIKALITDSVAQVESGSSLVLSAGATIDNVVQSVQQVTRLVSEMAESSQEQSHGIEQVSQAIAQLENITQQNVALVEETAAATETMQQDAAQLNAAVEVFQVCGSARNPAPMLNPSPRPAMPAAPARRPLPTRSRAA